MNYGFLYPGAALGLVVVLLILAGVKVPDRWLKLVIAVGLAQTALRLVFLSRQFPWGIDYKIFRDVGLDVLAGIDPYEPSRFTSHKFLNPPSAFPFFAAMALLPGRSAVLIWAVINSVLSLLIVPLSVTLMRRDPPEEGWKGIPPLEVGVLAVVFGLSDACTASIDVGQLPLSATFFVLLALVFRGRRPVPAGVFLAVATIKVNTAVPFLLLFRRRRDVASLAAFAASVAAMVLAAGHPERLVVQSRAMLHQIGALSRPGEINDITYAGITHESIIGFDHALYRLGVHDPAAYRAGQAVLLLALGGWLAWGVRTGRLAGARAAAVVSLFSVIFLYHRLYDTVMFAPALVLAFGESKWSRGRSRSLSVATVVLLLSILYMRRGPMFKLTESTLRWGVAGKLIQAAVLPYATWGILVSMAFLVLVGRRGYGIDPGPRPA